MPGLRPFLASALLLSSFGACDGDVLVGEFEVEATTNGGAGGVGGTSLTVGTTTNGGSAGAPGCEPQSCGSGPPLACGNCKDDDGDGDVDSQDADCLGPCQNSEVSYYGNIPGQNGGNCAQDCYFDQDSGGGNDKCYWDHGCDPLAPNPACPFDPDTLVGSPPTLSCQEAAGPPSEDCREVCLPLVPNGCDCFGCCQVAGDPNFAVWLGSEADGQGSCTLNDLADPEKCRPCTPVVDCFNDCSECEICVGRPEPPPSCGGNGETPQTCPPLTEGCGLTGQSSCSVDQYCITGCCITTIK